MEKDQHGVIRGHSSTSGSESVWSRSNLVVLGALRSPGKEGESRKRAVLQGSV